MALVRPSTARPHTARTMAANSPGGVSGTRARRFFRARVSTSYGITPGATVTASHGPELAAEIAEPVICDAVDDLGPFLLAGVEVRPRHRPARHGQQLAHRPLPGALDHLCVPLVTGLCMTDQRRIAAQLRRGQGGRGRCGG